MPVIKRANSPVLKAFSVRDIEEQAKALLLAARKRAGQLLEAGQAAAEEIKKEAHAQGVAQGKQEGFAQGLAEGRKAGHEQALQEQKPVLAQALTALTVIAGEVDARRQAMHEQGVHDVVELALAIASRVVKRQGALDPRVMLENLKQAITLVVAAGDLRIAIHPSQKALLEATLPQLQLSWPKLKHVELIEDEGIAPGGCRIHSAGGLVDADLQTQLDRVVEQLLPRGEGVARG